jgi:hypothetical protein
MPYNLLLLLKRPAHPIDILGNMLLKCADIVVALDETATVHVVTSYK